MNILGALNAIAGYGSGYVQGQEERKVNDYNQQMRQLAISDAQEQEQITRQKLKWQQMESDHAMRAFDPSITPTSGAPVPGGSPGSIPGPASLGQLPAQGSQDPQSLLNSLAQRTEENANYAYSIGDLTAANQLATNAVNMQNAGLDRQSKQSAIQTAELKRKLMSHQYVAQVLGDPSINDSPDPSAEFNRRLHMILADPNVSPEEASNLANLHYSPQIVDSIRNTGMNSAQQAQLQLRQMEIANQQAHERTMEGLTGLRVRAEQARTEAYINHEKNATKVGAVKAPTQSELKEAAPIIAQTVFGQTDPMSLQSNDTYRGILTQSDKSGKTSFNPNALPVVNIVGRAKQLMGQNRALTYPQAVAMSAKESKDSGEWQTQTSSNLTGMGSLEQALHITPGPSRYTTTKKEIYNAGGKGTKDNPLPVKGLTKQDLVDGAWYKFPNGEVHQYHKG